MMHGYFIGGGWLWMWLSMALFWLVPIGLSAAIVALIVRDLRPRG